MFRYQKKLVDDLGGFGKLEKYRNTFGDEWGAKHPFHTGQVAMQLDGEWRLGMAKDAGADFEIGTAPLPVADDEVDEYGKGFLSGTVMGIAQEPEAERRLGTGEVHDDRHRGRRRLRQRDPQRALHVPGPEVARPEDRPGVQDLMDIAQHPESNSPPASVNGSTYQLRSRTSATSTSRAG